MNEPKHGGCQCGAIRYRANNLRDNSHVCHCRMCQKSAGNFFSAFVGVPLTDFSWTRGQPSVFSSSEHVDRGFCGACGTPLFFRHDKSSYISMTIGSFDHPENIPLKFQLGMEARLPQMDQLAKLHDKGTTEEDDADGAIAIKSSNRQHPDHETSSWSSALENAMAQPVVFFDIAGPDDAALKSFYSSIFGWELDQAGRFSVPVATPIKGAIRKDPTEKRIYMGVPDVSACLSLIEQSGGTVDAPRFEVPGVVVLGLFRDPAGNPMGLVEMDGDVPHVP